jgi:hypothetical protein
VKGVTSRRGAGGGQGHLNTDIMKGVSSRKENVSLIKPFKKHSKYTVTLLNINFTCLQEAKLLAMILYRLWRELLSKLGWFRRVSSDV